MKGSGHDPQERRWERQKLLLSYAAETRRFEIERFWQRSLFFWTVLGAAFVGYGVLEPKARHAQLAVACFGLVAAVAWALQNRGAKYWQEAWEQKTKRYQAAVLQTSLFSHHEPRLPKGLFGAARYSVSKLAIMLSDFTVLIWAGLVLRSAGPEVHAILDLMSPGLARFWALASTHSGFLLLSVTAIWLLLMLGWGRSHPSGGEKDD